MEIERLKALAEAWAIAQDCEADWQWILAQAKANKPNATMQGFFIKPFTHQLTAFGPRWSALQKREFLPHWNYLNSPLLASDRTKWGVRSGLFTEEEVNQINFNKILRHQASRYRAVIPMNIARALHNQETVHDWLLILRTAKEWIPLSEEYKKLPMWVQTGWEMTLAFKLEKVQSAFVSKGKRKSRRILPCLSRLLPTNRERVSEKERLISRPGYITPNDIIRLDGVPSVYATLCQIAFEAEQDETFGTYDSDNIARGLHHFRSRCLPAVYGRFDAADHVYGHHFASDSSFMQNVGPSVSIRQVRATSREGDEVRPNSIFVQTEQQQPVQVQKKTKEESKIEKEMKELAVVDSRFEYAKEQAIQYLENFRPRFDQLQTMMHQSGAGGIPYLQNVGAPSPQEIWLEAEHGETGKQLNPLYPVAEGAHLRTVFVPWLGKEVTAPFWEFSVGVYSPRAFDTVFITMLADTEFEEAWNLTKAGFCAGWMAGRDSDEFIADIAGLGPYSDMQTAIGVMSAWEWYYRCHATYKATYKKRQELRLRHLHALQQFDRKGTKMSRRLDKNLPNFFQRWAPIVALKEVMENETD